MHYAIGYTPPPTGAAKGASRAASVPKSLVEVPPGVLRDTIGAAPPTGDSFRGVNPEKEGFVCSERP